MDIKKLFALRGKLDKQTSLILAIVGACLFLLVWIFLTMGDDPILKPATLPSPKKVFFAYGDLIRQNDLVVHAARSIGLNLSGYVVAIALSLPLGFLIGLVPLFRGLFQRLVEAIRFVPLIATIGIFIVWFGIGIFMKSNFLAFGIFIFLLPVVVQRIDEVKDVYLKTVYTLGATNWQTIKTVYIPSVMSRLSDDIRIMTAISWTYITFVEAIASEGGLGYLIIFGARRQGRMDKVFALLILIILIGVFQDKLFGYMDRKIFKFKYQTKNKYDHFSKGKSEKVFDVILDYMWLAFTWIALGVYVLAMLDEVFGIMGHINILSYLFGDTVWVIHVIFLATIVYKVSGLFKPKQK